MDIMQAGAGSYTWYILFFKFIALIKSIIQKEEARAVAILPSNKYACSLTETIQVQSTRKERTQADTQPDLTRAAKDDKIHTYPAAGALESAPRRCGSPGGERS